MTTPASAALSIRKSYCRPMPRPLSLTALPYEEGPDAEELDDEMSPLEEKGESEDQDDEDIHADLNRFRAILDSIGKVCGYPNLESLFLTRDIPPTPKAEFKAYSDSELKRLNAALVKLDEQIARLMIIHQMLGTRISDTLTLEPDCLSEKDGVTIIRIRQMKTKCYEKPISEELAALVRKAISYTKERCGNTPYTTWTKTASASRTGKAAGRTTGRTPPTGTTKGMWRFGGRHGRPIPTGHWRPPVSLPW